MGDYGNLWLSGSMMDYYGNRGRTTQLQAGYNTNIGRTSIGLALSRQNIRWRYGADNGTDSQVQKENIATLTLSVPLSFGEREHTLSFSASQAKQSGASSQVALAGALDKEETMNYALSSGWQQGQDGSRDRTDWSGTLQKSTAYGSLSGSYAQAQQYRQWTAGMRGAVVAHRHGIVLGPWVGDTFALVEAPGATGARVSSGHGARINEQGYALVPSLTPYRYNTIALDGSEMDGHAELQESQRRVVPMAGAAVKLSFATLSGYPLLVTLKGNDAFAPGEVVKDDRGNVVGMTGQGNQLYARVAAQSGALQMNDCRLPYSIDDEQRQAPLIALTLACQQEGKK